MILLSPLCRLDCHLVHKLGIDGGKGFFELVVVDTVLESNRVQVCVQLLVRVIFLESFIKLSLFLVSNHSQISRVPLFHSLR